MVCAYVREIIHSLKLVDYPPVQTHKPYNNLHIKGFIVCHCSFRDRYCIDYSLFIILKSKNKSVSKNRITCKPSTVRHFLVISTSHQKLGRSKIMRIIQQKKTSPNCINTGYIEI